MPLSECDTEISLSVKGCRYKINKKILIEVQVFEPV
jgi:hypothetical protein